LLGVAFLGWIHDYTSAQVSIRKEGMSLGGMSYTLISPRGRTLVSVFIYFNLMFGFGAFAIFISGVLSNPTAPLGIIIWVVMGLLFGQMIYKWKMGVLTATAIAVIVTLIGIFFLTSLGPVQSLFKWINGGDPSPILFGTITQAKFVWIWAYSSSAISGLPCPYGAGPSPSTTWASGLSSSPCVPQRWGSSSGVHRSAIFRHTRASSGA
jgi:carbon starvation protein CstA